VSLQNKLLTHFVFVVFSVNVCMLAAAQHADVAAQCRIEAEGYAIPQEQLEEYIDGCMLASGGSLSSAPEQSVGIESQCRQEAKDYGVAPEQLADYVNGCILSLGGILEAEPVVEDEQAAPDPATTDVEPQEMLQDPVEVQ